MAAQDGNATLLANMTLTSSDDLYEYSMQYRITATSLNFIIFVIGIVGNMATIYVVLRTKSMHTPTYCYLVSLAFADLLVLISSLPEAFASPHLFRGQWIFGHVTCAVSVFINFLGINASSTSICCFTIERYIGICHPLLAQKLCSVQRAKRIIIGIWIFAVVYCAPWLGLANIRSFYYPDHGELHSCTFRLSRQTYVYIFLTDILLFYVTPLLISIYVYIRIALALRQNSRNGPRRNYSVKSRSSTACLNGQEPRLNQQKDSLAQVIRMLVTVVTCFAFLWLPYRGLLVYNSFVPTKFSNIWYLLFAKISIYVNSAVNPVLYSVLSKRFREALIRHVLPCIPCVSHANKVRKGNCHLGGTDSAEDGCRASFRRDRGSFYGVLNADGKVDVCSNKDPRRIQSSFLTPWNGVPRVEEVRKQRHSVVFV